jgi:NAD(P)-dependent dehydrogenase (short-subunit alcohol dehydrogenase family)
MLLEHKKAVIYGAAGAIGGAVACAFAHEDANLFLAGRTRARVDRRRDPTDAARQPRRRTGGSGHGSSPSRAHAERAHRLKRTQLVNK